MTSEGLLRHALEAAQREAGAEDFGPEDFREPLRVYLELEDRAPLTDGGRLQQRDLVQRCLVNRLRFTHDLTAHPEILREDVSDPIVVLGFPRSGTTVLQRMLSADPAMQKLALWQALNPAPLPDEVPGMPTGRLAIAHATEQAIRTHNPALFTAHPMIATEAEEDWFLHHLAFQHVGNVFWSLISQEYLAYLRSLPRLPTYRYVANLLRYLQWQEGGKRGRRWVLKSPVHIGCLDALLDVHPRATFVYPRRDFPTVVASFCHALESSVGSTLRITPAQIGELAMAFWIPEMARFHESRRRLGDSLRLSEIHYQDLLQDPIRHARAIYELAGTRLTPEGEEAMCRWLADNPAGKHGKNMYDLERYGLTKDRVERAFAEFE